MRREDLVAFATRPRHLVEESRASYWASFAAASGAAGAQLVADELLRLVRAARPEWPSPSDREADLRLHTRLSDAFRRVKPASSR